MPTLNWPTKRLPDLPSASLVTDALVYPQGRGYPDRLPENRLIMGDNLRVMASLIGELEGQVDLIYADPPFFTNRRYPARIGRGEDSRRPREWALAEGYPDHWPDLDAYLDMLYPRLALMHRLLAPHGTLYLHLDWHANAYARLLLDEIFGPERLLNEVVWVYHGPSPILSAFKRKHDTILVYTKGEKYTFNADAVREPYDPNTVKTFASSLKAGFGKVPDLDRGKVPEDWWYFPVVARLHSERTGYPTQKPAALLERIVLASSNPGDLVADFFCGSGTTAVAAARLGRRFIAGDSAWRAVHTAQTRLVCQASPPFALQREARSADLQPGSIEHGELAWTSGDRLELSPAAAERLDYWEVDPDWDGQVFRSAVQAVRNRKEHHAPQSVDLPELLANSRPVCVRMVTTDGAVAQSIVKKG